MFVTARRARARARARAARRARAPRGRRRPAPRAPDHHRGAARGARASTRTPATRSSPTPREGDAPGLPDGEAPLVGWGGCPARWSGPSTRAWSSSGRAPGWRSRSASRTCRRCSARGSASPSPGSGCSLIARLMGRPLRTDARLAAVLALLPFAAAYGLIYWGEQYVPSGLAAVLFGSCRSTARCSRRCCSPASRCGRGCSRGIAVALAGLSLAFGETLELGHSRYALAAAIACAAAPFASAIGNVAIKRDGGALDAVVLNGWAMLARRRAAARRLRARPRRGRSPGAPARSARSPTWR